MYRVLSLLSMCEVNDYCLHCCRDLVGIWGILNRIRSFGLLSEHRDFSLRNEILRPIAITHIGVVSMRYQVDRSTWFAIEHMNTGQQHRLVKMKPSALDQDQVR
jgi:hypothetical protein